MKFSFLKVPSAGLKGKSRAKAVPEVCPAKQTSANHWGYFELLIQIESGNFYVVLAHPQSLTLQWHKHDTVHPVAVFLFDWWLEKSIKAPWQVLNVDFSRNFKKKIQSLWGKNNLGKARSLLFSLKCIFGLFYCGKNGHSGGSMGRLELGRWRNVILFT